VTGLAFLFFSHAVDPRGRIVAFQQNIEVQRTTAAVLIGTMFRVELENKYMVFATIVARCANLLCASHPAIELDGISSYEVNKERITRRLR
jgi:hypothetical protein